MITMMSEAGLHKQRLHSLDMRGARRALIDLNSSRPGIGEELTLSFAPADCGG